MVELQTDCCHVARAQEPRCTVDRRSDEQRVFSSERTGNHQHPTFGFEQETVRGIHDIACGVVLCKRVSQWHGETVTEASWLSAGLQHRGVEQVAGLMAAGSLHRTMHQWFHWACRHLTTKKAARNEKARLRGLFTIWRSGRDKTLNPENPYKSMG
jgi:hypothetical protein